MSYLSTPYQTQMPLATRAEGIYIYDAQAAILMVSAGLLFPAWDMGIQRLLRIQEQAGKLVSLLTPGFSILSR